MDRGSNPDGAKFFIWPNSRYFCLFVPQAFFSQAFFPLGFFPSGHHPGLSPGPSPGSLLSPGPFPESSVLQVIFLSGLPPGLLFLRSSFSQVFFPPGLLSPLSSFLLISFPQGFLSPGPSPVPSPDPSSVPSFRPSFGPFLGLSPGPFFQVLLLSHSPKSSFPRTFFSWVFFPSGLHLGFSARPFPAPGPFPRPGLYSFPWALPQGPVLIFSSSSFYQFFFPLDLLSPRSSFPPHCVSFCSKILNKWCQNHD